MSKDNKNGHFDFIRQYDAKLNLIYRQWEKQIENQANAPQAQSFLAKAWTNKKVFLAVGAVAFGSSLVVWQANRQINTTQNFIYSNCHELNRNMYAD